MLAYVLAIAVGVGSLALYMAAFFRPEVHRKDDFFWSGVGLFYALVLWICAGRITGGVLLGQLAGVSLLGWFGWETVKLRRAIAHPEAIAEIESFSLIEWTQTKINGLSSKFKAKPKTVPQTTEEVVEQVETAVEDKIAEVAEKVEQNLSERQEATAEVAEKTTETVAEMAENLTIEEQEAYLEESASEEEETAIIVNTEVKKKLEEIDLELPIVIAEEKEEETKDKKPEQEI